MNKFIQVLHYIDHIYLHISVCALVNLVVTTVFTSSSNLNFKLKGSLTINSYYKTRYKRQSFELVTLLWVSLRLNAPNFKINVMQYSKSYH